MLDVVVVLVIIALMLLFLRAGRQNTIVYRKKVAPPDREYSIRDHPDAFGPTTPSDYHALHEYTSEQGVREGLVFEGGTFGGSGAGDSYETGQSGQVDNCSGNFEAGDGNFYANDTDLNASDSGGDNSGSNDCGSDSGSGDSAGGGSDD